MAKQGIAPAHGATNHGSIRVLLFRALDVAMPACPRPSFLLLGLLLICCLGAAPEAHAKKKSGSKAKGRTATTSMAVQRSSSEESRSERERRLKRECRGRPNAGACLGYAY